MSSILDNPENRVRLLKAGFAGSEIGWLAVHILDDIKKNSKLEIQNITEKLLAKYDIDSTKDFYLKLSIPYYLDLVMERNGSTIRIGHYFVQNSDLMSDPIFVMEDIDGYWSPLRIEQPLRIFVASSVHEPDIFSVNFCGDIICAYYQHGRLTIYPGKMQDFRIFQRMFARSIREQGWLEDGVKSERSQ